MKVLVGILLSILCLGLPLQADHSLRIRSINIEGGLPQSTVRAISQDQAGLLYFATDDGISQFDGIRHIHLHDKLTKTQQLFTFTDVCTLDKKVIGTALEGGVLVFDNLKNKANEWVLEDALATTRTELIACAVNHLDQKVYVASKQSIFSLSWTPQGIEQDILFEVDPQKSWSINHIESINRQLMVATDAGLFTLRDGKRQALLDLNHQQKVIDFAIKDGRLWVLYSNRLAVFDWQDTQWQIVLSDGLNDLNAQLAREAPSRLLLTNRHAWVGTHTRGIFVLDDDLKMFSHYHSKNPSTPLNDDNLLALYQSSDNTVFAGTRESGVIQINVEVSGVRGFTSFLTDRMRLESPSIKAIYQSPEGFWWLGTDKNGLLVGDSLSSSLKQFDRFSTYALPSNSVRAITGFDENTMLIGTENGIGFFNLSNGFELLPGSNEAVEKVVEVSAEDVSVQPVTPSSRYPGIRIRAIYVDQNKNIWVGTYDKGLFLKQNGNASFIQLQLGSPLKPAKITSMVPENNDLWVATDNLGVFVIDRSNFLLKRHFTAEGTPFKKLPNNAIRSIYLHKNNDSWIGSYGQGAARLNSKTGVFDYFKQESGLSNDVIYSVLADNENHLWMSTNRGLNRLNLTDFSITHFFYFHGLPYDEFNSGSYFKSELGRLYFGTLKGLVEINPKEIEMPVSYDVTISSILINGQNIDLHPNVISLDGPVYRPSRLVVDKDYQRIEFFLSTTEYRQVDAAKFRYRLIGKNLDWIELQNYNSTIVFNDLEYGNYRLQVGVKNTNGHWSNDYLEIDLILNPPWYWSKWSIIAYLLIGFLIVLFSIEVINRSRKKSSKLLAKLQYMVDHRTQELKTKNQQLESLNLELQQANENLKKMSVLDALTGLGNRRMLYQFLERDIGEVNRAYMNVAQNDRDFDDLEEHDLLFFLIDIDYFKRINDEYGHMVGDRVLVEISQLLKRLSREGDLVIRFGGEEFLIVMRNTPRSQAEEIANRILKAFRQYEFSVSSDKKVEVHCSIGFAPYPFSVHSPSQVLAEQVIQIADMCLYSAKMSGRNCCIGLAGIYQPDQVKVDDILSRTANLIEKKQLIILGAQEVAQLQWKDNRHM